jgi:hypothetical protein
MAELPKVQERVVEPEVHPPPDVHVMRAEEARQEAPAEPQAAPAPEPELDKVEDCWREGECVW